VSSCRLCGAPLRGAAGFDVPGAPVAAQAFTSSADAARASRTTLRIVECPSCGLVQSASPAVASYRQAITAAGVSASMRAHRLAQARRLAASRAGARTALVGCGTGYELAVLAEAGLAPEGIEWGGAPPDYAGSWPIHDGYPGRDAPLPGGPYAACACFNFLEHAPDPAGFLRGIATALEAGAVGVFEVPNYAQMIRERRAFDYVADHLSYFDAGTLRTALALGGLLVDEIEEVRGGENLAAWVRPRASAPLAEHGVALAAIRADLIAHLQAVRDRGGCAAVWGASHQALTLLSGTDPALLRGIIDSAAAKQGRFAPASGIPVVAPDDADVRTLDSVIIIASGYVDEIRSRLTAMGFGGTAHAIRGGRIVSLD